MIPHLILTAIASLGMAMIVHADESTNPNLDTTTESVSAPDTGALLNSMEERVPMISLLQEQGLVGIGNDGQLSIRGSISEQQTKAIRAENNDRKAYCEILAKEYGESFKKIQKEFAAEKIKIASPGTFIEDEDGDWVKKGN